MIVFSDEELQRYGERFLWRLYHMADGIIERAFDRYEVFRNTGIGGIPEQGVRQATDELVQHLWSYDFIRTSENSAEIRLSLAGLTEAERICKKFSPVTSLP